MPPGYGYLTRDLDTGRLMLGEAVQIINGRDLVLESKEKTRLRAENYIHVQASTATMNKNTGIQGAITNGTPVPSPRVRITPQDRGTRGAIANRRAARRRPLRQQRQPPSPWAAKQLRQRLRAGVATGGLSPAEDENQPFRPRDGDPGLLAELAISSVEKPSPAGNASKRAGRSSPWSEPPRAWAPPSRDAA
jgi:hypothetical protein